MSESRRYSSLSQKYSIFTGLLLCYLIVIFLAYDIAKDDFNLIKAGILSVTVLLVAGAISKYTNRLLARPLSFLQAGTAAVRDGNLKPIQVSRTGDEIELLGESFNAMIKALVASQEEIRQYQESLEERIRQRTEALEDVSKKALAASNTKSEFLANMSHELRTPISGVLGMIDIVLDSRLESEQKEHLLIAKGCANTLLALLNDLLDLSKIEAGKMVLEDIPFDSRSVVTECVKSLQIKAQQKGISLRSEISSEVPAQIAGDPLRLRQIVSNLLSNAVKFTGAGSVEIRLEMRPAASDDKQELVIEVVDTGVGIPPEKLSTIFEEFTQADGSIGRRYGGTGLGLAITRKLVEMHGGRISVDSTPGRGSTFRVSVPCKPVSLAAAEGVGQVNQGAGEASRGNTKPSTEKILIVEDNPVNQKVVAAMLRREGYTVELANHGGEALEALEATPVSLVLMDIQMPVIDGLEATRRIRQDARWKDLPIVAMTAHTMDGDRERCLERGMDGYLSKPVNRPHLIATIEKHLLDRARGRGIRTLRRHDQPASGTLEECDAALVRVVS